MDKNLPARPNLDHLRRQAKSLLAALAAGETDAISTLLQHLPAASDMTADQIRKARFRLADAQSAIARKSGFASWPQLARHVEQLRSLEGTWAFAGLEIDGSMTPAAAMQSSRLLIDGDRFRCESPDANYDGIFNIDVEAQPHQIAIEFVEGPEAGKWNFGIFRIEGDRLEICLDVNGKPCPTDFRTSPGSGHAYEILKRTSSSQPDSVTGGTPSVQTNVEITATRECVGFDYVASPTLTRLQGQWTAEKLVQDGNEFPKMMCVMGRRVMANNETTVAFGGRVMVHALVRINERATPIEIDYYILAGPPKGTIQQGIMEWRDEVACFCMSAPGGDRPSNFECPVGSARTLSHWRLKK